MSPLFRRPKEKKHPKCAALVAAAGQSSRMAGVNKLMEPLQGVPVLVRTLLALEQASGIDEIVLAVREEEIVPISNLCVTWNITKCTKVVRGGKSRAHSVLLAALEVGSDVSYLAVQDGARPLVSPRLINAVVEKASVCGAAAPAIPVKDTIKEVSGEDVVNQTLNRGQLRAVQTPQVFDASLLKGALQQALSQNLAITDDCSAVELLGKKVYLIDGEETNLKITTPLDLVIAESILAHPSLLEQ